MTTKDLTPELDTHNSNFTEGAVLFIHPMLDDCFARVRINFDGWRPEQWQYAFDEIWSSDDFAEEDKKALEKAAKEFWAEKVAEYEEERESIEEYSTDAEEHFMDFY